MMSTNSRHDAWGAGDNYDPYMGQSRAHPAPRFLEWLEVQGGRDWLEVGCGIGVSFEFYP